MGLTSTMKILAIDIDGTWTADPERFILLWGLFTNPLFKESWRVIIVTGSEQPQEKLTRLGVPPLVQVITCAPGQFKRDAALAAGYDVTVWMDDQPGTIEPQRKLSEPNDQEL
jgi:hypothetical protein